MELSIIFIEIAEITLINPLVPQSWGTFESGGHPQSPDRKYPVPLFNQTSIYVSLKTP